MATLNMDGLKNILRNKLGGMMRATKDMRAGNLIVCVRCDAPVG